MRYFAILALSGLLLIGCNSTESNNHNWIRSYNQSLLKSAKRLIEETGNKKGDVAVLEDMRQYSSVTDSLMNLLDSGKKEEVLLGLKLHIDSLDKYDNKIDEYFNLTTNSSSTEIKVQTALVEMETFEDYVRRIGAEDLSFDVLDLYFIPDDLLIRNDQDVTGKLVFAASNSQLTSRAKLYVNDKEIEVEDGFGKVNVPFSDIQNTLELKTRIHAEIVEFELSKDIKLTPIE